MQPFIFQIWVEQKVELSFSVSRTVELSSEGASEVVSTLKSIGSSENGPEECVCETTEARHELACAVLLGSACACVFSLVFRFYRHGACRFRYHEGWQVLQTANARLRKFGYEAKNFRVTVLSRSSVAVHGVYDLGTVLMAAECGLYKSYSINT